MKRRKSTALLYLEQWGENVRLRAGGDVGRGIGDDGRFKPADDPHPACWVSAQVERELKKVSPEMRRMAEQVYVGRRSVHSLRNEYGGRMKAHRLHRKLVDRVHSVVVDMRERTIAEAHAKQLLDEGHFDGPGWKAVFDWLAGRR